LAISFQLGGRGASRDLGLDLLERIWSRSKLDEDEAMELAVEAQHRTRP
jgi:hypothetical protein